MKKPLFEKWKPEEKRKLLFDLLADLESEERKVFEQTNVEPISIGDSFTEMQRKDKEVTIYHWPIDFLQRRLAGYWPGEVYTIGGATGIGKSLLAAFLTLKFALDGGKTLYFSTEMPNSEITRRMWVMWAEYLGDRDNFVSLPVDYGDEKWGVTPELISRLLELNAERAKEGLDKKYELVVIDNLHWFMRGGDSVAEDIGIITKKMKELALKYQVSVILVSHVNREAGKLQENKTPPMNFLKGSSYIEQDSDAVIMITRKKDETGKKTNFSLLTLEKNRRNGRTVADITVRVNDNLTFKQVDRDPDDE